jgi:hypothetical protein
MTITKVVTKEELLEHIGPWQLLWYAVIDTEVNEENEYDFLYLLVELGCYYRIIDEQQVLKLVVNLNNLSKAEVTELINKVSNKSVQDWLQILNYMHSNRLIEIDKIWKDKSE